MRSSDERYRLHAPSPTPERRRRRPDPPRGLGDILSTAFEIYKANAAELIKLVAIVVVPLALIQAFFLTVLVKPCVVGDVNTFQDVVDLADRCTGGIGRSLLQGALVGFFLAAAQQLLLGALTRGGAGALLGRPVDVNASYRYAFSRLWGMIGLALLVALLVGIGFILLFFPGLIIAVFLSMSIPAFIIERKGVGDSLARSWELVRGSWWHTFGVIVVAGLLAGIVQSIFNAIGGTNFFLYWILSAIGQVLTTPFVALVAVVLYVDLRSRHEQMTAEQLGRELDAAGA